MIVMVMLMLMLMVFVFGDFRFSVVLCIVRWFVVCGLWFVICDVDVGLLRFFFMTNNRAAP
jgi:hypothetical protein